MKAERECGKRPSKTTEEERAEGDESTACLSTGEATVWRLQWEPFGAPTGNHFLILKRAERGVPRLFVSCQVRCGSPQTAFREQVAALLRLSLLAARNLTTTMKGSTVSQCFAGGFFFPQMDMLNKSIRLNYKSTDQTLTFEMKTSVLL